tara:strand:+ start:194 stop:340 length:147 start_codon:yes stop_codon:yes gene_type:complete
MNKANSYGGASVNGIFLDSLSKLKLALRKDGTIRARKRGGLNSGEAVP